MGKEMPFTFTKDDGLVAWVPKTICLWRNYIVGGSQVNLCFGPKHPEFKNGHDVDKPYGYLEYNTFTSLGPKSEQQTDRIFEFHEEDKSRHHKFKLFEAALKEEGVLQE